MKQKAESNKRDTKLIGQGNGDNIWFFILSQMYGLFAFFIFAYSFDLFETISTISELLSIAFFSFYINIFIWNLVSSVIGWFLAYLTLKIVKIYILNTKVKSLGDLSKGLNKFPLTSLAFYISTLISSFCFSIGALTILESFLFYELSMITLMITFLIMKLCIYAITKMIIESKF